MKAIYPVRRPKPGLSRRVAPIAGQVRACSKQVNFAPNDIAEQQLQFTRPYSYGPVTGLAIAAIDEPPYR